MKTFTKAFETKIAKLFFENFVNSTENNYYVFAAKTTPYENGSTLPTIGKGVTSSFYDIHDQIIFGKKLTDADIRYMVKKNVWATGTVYDMYDDKDENLFDKNFFVFTEEGSQYSLFKCLFNNFGVPSTDKPLLSRTSYSDDLYQTGDGYVWKLLTTISSTEFSKFETDDYAPLEHISDAPTYAKSGSIDVIVVENEGSSYNTFAYGSIKSTAYLDDPSRFTIQTDTEKDIYELTLQQSGTFLSSGENVYLWTFPIGTDTSTILTALATADYNNVSSNDSVDLLGVVYAADEPILQVSRDLNFNLSYADFAGSNMFFTTKAENITSAAVVARLTATATALSTSNALFLVEISGRKLGDITGNGAVSALDALAWQGYFAGTLTDPTQIAYINSVMLPFMYANASTYANYIPFHFGLVTGLQIILVPELSANNSFYTGSSLYIRGGTGAGQLKTITDYDIVGNDRIITVDTPFEIEIDSTSRYEISPRVVIEGDGTGAKAIAKSTLAGGTAALVNGIRTIEVVDVGSDYTFANVTITGNTGILDTEGNSIATNSAVARAIISPPKGHGYDLINETYAVSIGVSVDFVSNEHPTSNTDYHMFGVIVNPVFKSITLAISGGSLPIGDTITQNTTGAKGTVVSIYGDFVTLDQVTGVWSTSYGIDLDENIVILSVTGDTTKFDNRTKLTITTTISGDEFYQDEKIVQETTGTIGYVHYHDVPNNTLYVTEVQGTFLPGDGYSISGQTSGVIATINTITESDIYPDAGEILYIETIQPITRNDGQTERVKIVTKF